MANLAAEIFVFSQQAGGTPGTIDAPAEIGVERFEFFQSGRVGRPIRRLEHRVVTIDTEDQCIVSGGSRQAELHMRVRRIAQPKRK